MTHSGPETLICSSSAELPDVARQLLALAGDRRLFCLSGDLGAGKTALVTAMVQLLGSRDQVSSPTFSLVQDYISRDLNPNVIHHIDAYRLEDLEEALDIGILDYLDDDAWTFIEWPELLESVLPDRRIDLEIRILPNSAREIVFLKR